MKWVEIKWKYSLKSFLNDVEILGSEKKHYVNVLL